MAGRLETAGECACTLIAICVLDAFALTLVRCLAGLAAVASLEKAVLYDVFGAGKNPLATPRDTCGLRLWNS